ncbi:MAG: hypothetical protein AWU57_1503 [Marinobacter sp. T13-3]|nr:MAG: hypothetical protein AWU57_1503 [Marinobacter sp. T13-3]
MKSAVRYPPQDYRFNEAPYKGRNQELEAEYSDFGSSIRTMYPELSEWSNWACFDAWMEYGEKTQFLSDPDLPDKRDIDFLAFLYAEQELAANGYFVRPDGSKFTHYDLDGLGEIWRRHEAAHQTG